MSLFLGTVCEGCRPKASAKGSPLVRANMAALIRGKFPYVRRDRAGINFKAAWVKMAHAFAVRAFAVFLIAIGCRYAREPMTTIVSERPVRAVTADRASS